jgi:hypothetical protein
MIDISTYFLHSLPIIYVLRYIANEAILTVFFKPKHHVDRRRELSEFWWPPSLHPWRCELSDRCLHELCLLVRLGFFCVINSNDSAGHRYEQEMLPRGVLPPWSGRCRRRVAALHLLRRLWWVRHPWSPPEGKLVAPGTSVVAGGAAAVLLPQVLCFLFAAAGERVTWGSYQFGWSIMGPGLVQPGISTRYCISQCISELKKLI